MARGDNYYQNIQTQPTPAAPQPSLNAPTYNPRPVQNNIQTPAIVSPEQQNRNIKTSILKQEAENAVKRSQRPAWQYIPSVVAEQIYTMPSDEQWQSMSTLGKASYISEQNLKLGWNILKGIPKVIAGIPANLVKAPFIVAARGSQTLTDISNAAANMILGEPEPGSLREEFQKPAAVLMGTKGYSGLLEENKTAGFSNFISHVATTGRLSGELAMALTGFDFASGIKNWATSPRLVNVPGTKKVTVEDTRGLPRTAAESARISSQAPKAQSQAIGGSRSTLYTKIEPGAFAKWQQSVRTSETVQSQIKRMGVNSDNVFMRIVPKSNGKASLEIVELRPAPLNVMGSKLAALKEKFGRSNVVPGEMGPEVKIFSTEISYNPGNPTANFSRGTSVAAQKQVNAARELPVTTVDQAKNMSTASFDDIQEPFPDKPKEGESPFDSLASMNLTEPPSLMSRPLKGFENAPVSDKEISQVLMLNAHKALPQEIPNALSQIIAGTENLYDLTKTELYKVSELLRTFSDKEVNKNLDLTGTQTFSSYFLMNRDWMAMAENRAKDQGMKAPLVSEILYPLETAKRLSQVYRESQSKIIQDIFKEYGETSALGIPKYEEDLRLIGAYAKGDKAAITENPTLSDQQKKEMSQIGDSVIEYFKNRFKDNVFGLTSTRFFGNYLPQIQKKGGINSTWKEDQMPAEMKVFAQFEREGQFNVLEDNPIVLMQAFAQAEAKAKFIKPVYERAQTIIGGLPTNMANATKDVVGEILGHKDGFEKRVTEMGQQLAKTKFGKKVGIPENVTQQVIKFWLSNAYAGALGLPRMMSAVRNLASQSIVIPYADAGPENYTRGIEYISKVGLGTVIKEMRDEGFAVKSGVMYGAEISERAGRGKIGRVADAYEKLNELSMVSEGGPDTINRAITYSIAKTRFAYNLDLLKNNKISYEKFEQNIDISGYSKPIQDLIRKEIAENTPESLDRARQIIIKETIDNQQYGYRRGSGSRFHHGLMGKALGQFSMYTWAYSSMVGQWAARGQWDKIVRLLGISTAVVDSFKDAYGIDVKKWVGLAPTFLSGAPISPALSIAGDLAQATRRSLEENLAVLEENRKDIISTIGIFGGVFTGIGVQRWANVKKSIDMYEKAPAFRSTDPNKPFSLWSKTGKVRDLSFPDLIMYGIGFDSIDGTREFETLNILNEQERKKNSLIKEAMSELIKGDFDKFTEIYTENQMNFNPQDHIDSFQKTILQRRYDRMSAADKAKYFSIIQPLLFPQLNNNQ